MIPRLETERLILRGYRPADFEPLAAFLADPEVARFIAPAPLTREQAWRSLAASIGHWHLRGYGTWAIERKSDGAFIGRAGMMKPEGWPGLEIGWTLGRPYWGAGYATEAADAAMRYAFLTEPVERIISCIDKENVASQKVAARLGETRGETRVLSANGESFAVEIWSITCEEWRRRNR